jgi:hypothetical protein
VPAGVYLVTVRMIENLFSRVSRDAFDPMGAHVYIIIFGTLQRLDEGTHLGHVVVDERIAAQPASIDIGVSEGAK